jgi:ATP synthase protein I
VAADANGTGRTTRPHADEGAARALGLGTGWVVFSYLIAGMVAYGIIGWAIGKAVHVGLLFPIGMMVGLAISVSYVIYRYGRQGSVERDFAGQGKSKGMTSDR